MNRDANRDACFSEDEQAWNDAREAYIAGLAEEIAAARCRATVATLLARAWDAGYGVGYERGDDAGRAWATTPARAA